MLDLIPHIIAFFAIGVWVGFAASWLDTVLDYGHIGGRLRYRLAERVLRDAEPASTSWKLRAELRTAAAKTDFHDRMQSVSNCYWKIAVEKPSFLPWICVVCMSGRLAVSAAVVVGIYTSLSGGWWGVAEAGVAAAVIVPVAYVTVKKIME